MDAAVVREFQTVRRYVPLLSLLWQVHQEGEYSGITFHAYCLTMQRDTRSEWVRRVVYQARDANFVRIQRTGYGRGAKAVIRLTTEGESLCRRLFEGGKNHG